MRGEVVNVRRQFLLFDKFEPQDRQMLQDLIVISIVVVGAIGGWSTVIYFRNRQFAERYATALKKAIPMGVLTACAILFIGKILS